MGELVIKTIFHLFECFRSFICRQGFPNENGSSVN
ncbi:unnamed protein product [Nezara viridula]|uniref:Uncharacterized protein n=1 Tax=Nezara viridula TaxID=85310 RepID=A0A9P0H4S2_NEZVI|nr:unnamed protein product [Nezara viridula]